MRRVILASMMVVLAAAGCKKNTELMFGFATDLKAKGQIDRVDFKVFDAQSQVVEIATGWDLADVPAGLYELPGSFGVFTDDGAEPSLQVDFVGSLGGQEILKREAILSPVAGKTLFMRLTLVGECDEATGVHCPSGQSCVEGVCRAPLVNNATLLPYTKGMENEFACDSGTQFVLSSTGAVIPAKGSCAGDQFCQEGTCYAESAGRVAGHRRVGVDAAAGRHLDDGALGVHHAGRRRLRRRRARHHPARAAGILGGQRRDARSGPRVVGRVGHERE